MRHTFFSPKFSRYFSTRYLREVFSLKKPIMRALFFVNLLTLKMREGPISQASSVSWLPVSPSAPELVVLGKANLIFQ